jgi:hypothetical protein
VTGDTDSLLLHDGNDDKIIHEFTAECKKKIGVDIEHSQMFIKAALSKETLLGVTASGEIIVVGMEREKNDRYAWINKCLIGSLKTLK